MQPMNEYKQPSMLERLWRDEAGALMSTEYLLLGALLTIGLVVGLSAMQVSLLSELEDYAAAIIGIDNGGLAGTGDVNFTGNEAGLAGP